MVAVVGAAGTGKTTLTSTWFERLDGPRAWIDCRNDPGPGDMRRTLAAAAVRLGVAPTDVDVLPPPSGPGLGRPLTDHLVKVLGRTAAPWTLVLEDIDRLPFDLRADVGTLIDRVGNTPHRVVVTSALPLPWPLASWQAAGRLTYVGADDLAFTEPEVRDLLGARVDEVVVTDLVTGVEGWAAAVGAARTALGDSPAASAANLRSSVVRFMADELIPSLDLTPEEHRVLCRASVLARTTGPVAAAVSEDPAAASTLRAVARRLGIVHEVGTDDFELPPLLRDALRRRLDDLEPGTEAYRHRLAASAWRAEGDGVEATAQAMEHLIAARAWDEALDLIDQSWGRVFSAARVELQIEWLDRIPEHRWEERVEAVLTYLTASLLTGRLDRALDRLALMPAVHHPVVAPMVKLARAHGVWWTTPPEEALDSGRTALAEMAGLAERIELPLLPVVGGVEQYSPIVELGQARAHFLLGQTGRARAVFESVIDDPAALPPTRLSAQASLGLMAALRGEPAEVAAITRAVFDVVDPAGAGRSLARDLADLADGFCCYLENDLDAAMSAALESAATAEAMGAAHHLQMARLLASLCGASARDLGARPALADAPLVPLVRQFVVASEARTRGRGGDLDGAYALLSGIRPAEQTLGLWVELGLARAGVEQTRRWLDAQPPAETPWGEVVRGLCEATLAVGDARATALDSVDRLLPGSGLDGLLADAPRQLLQAGDQHPVLSRSRAARDARVEASPPGLSPRELELVRMLDGPASVPELAERLYISANTVKSHLRQVYRKLGVASRADAVSRAIELGLLAARK